MRFKVRLAIASLLALALVYHVWGDFNQAQLLWRYVPGSLAYVAHSQKIYLWQNRRWSQVSGRAPRGDTIVFELSPDGSKLLYAPEKFRVSRNISRWAVYDIKARRTIYIRNADAPKGWFDNDKLQMDTQEYYDQKDYFDYYDVSTKRRGRASSRRRDLSRTSINRQTGELLSDLHSKQGQVVVLSHDYRNQRMVRGLRNPVGGWIEWVGPKQIGILPQAEKRKTGKLKIFNKFSGRLIRELKLPPPLDDVTWFKASPDGRKLLLGGLYGNDYHTLRLMDARTGKFRHLFTDDVGPGIIEWLPDSRHFLVTFHGYYLNRLDDLLARVTAPSLWLADSERKDVFQTKILSNIRDVAWSPQ